MDPRFHLLERAPDYLFFRQGLQERYLILLKEFVMKDLFSRRKFICLLNHFQFTDRASPGQLEGLTRINQWIAVGVYTGLAETFNLSLVLFNIQSKVQQQIYPRLLKDSARSGSIEQIIE